jgi:hypothetical protein
MKVIKTPITTAVVIYGPKGSGKTTNAPALAKFYGKDRIVDDFSAASSGYKLISQMPTDTLFILSGDGPERDEKGTGALIHIYDACKAAGIEPHPSLCDGDIQDSLRRMRMPGLLKPHDSDAHDPQYSAFERLYGLDLARSASESFTPEFTVRIDMGGRQCGKTLAAIRDAFEWHEASRGLAGTDQQRADIERAKRLERIRSIRHGDYYGDSGSALSCRWEGWRDCALASQDKIDAARELARTIRDTLDRMQRAGHIRI